MFALLTKSEYYRLTKLSSQSSESGNIDTGLCKLMFAHIILSFYNNGFYSLFSAILIVLESRNARGIYSVLHSY